MAETAIVTLRLESYCKDYELPVKVPLGELYPRLLTVLQEKSSRFGEYNNIVLEYRKCGMTDKTATLADYGVVSGVYLDIAREEEYHGIR